MPGLDADILKKAADKLKLMWYGQMVNLSPEQWIAFEDTCRTLLNLPESWKERAYLMCYERAKMAGWTSRYGPGAPGGWKRKAKPSEEIINIQEEQSLEGTLFE